MKNIRTAAAVIFLMMVLFFPTMTASAASCGEIVSQNTAAELQAVDYGTDKTIGSLLAPYRYSAIDKLNKKTEIAKREGKSPAEITDEQAIQELNQDNVKVMSFEETFQEVQADIGEIIKRVVDSNPNAVSQGADFLTNKIRQNKEKLLIGLTYLARLYDFNMGEHNIKDVLLYEPGAYGISADVLDWLIQIGGAGGDTLKISNNANVFGYRKLFWTVTESPTLESFLEENRQKWIPDRSMNEWFLQESPAYILEYSSQWDSRDAGLYKRLCEDGTFQAYILPLLTVSEDSVYVIANSATVTYGIVDCYIDRNLRKTDPSRYEAMREKIQQKHKQAGKQQKAFIDVWYRIAKPEKKGLLSSNRVVLDSLRIDPDTTVQWSDKFGENAARGVKEFFAPLNLYGPYMFADGVAEGTRIRYYVSKALTERGFATYAHELTHMLVSELMLGGYGSRDGILAEVYTRGMFEPYEINDPPAFTFNLIYDRLAASDRYHNGQPERFMDETDLQSYMGGILDVVYTLDYAEAEAVLTKSAQEKLKWFHKLEQVEDPEQRVNQGEEGSVHYLDSVRELTVEEAERLNTIDDLITNNIIVSRYEVNGTKTTGTMARNGYYVVPLFSANYAGVQNDHGVSGDVMIRRQAFELLAEYGYYGGMVPYISNQYKEAAKSEQTILSDQYILKKIFGGAYETMADFKKAMFRRRMERIDELKPVTIMWKNQSVTINSFEELRQLMNEAIESDLLQVNLLPDGANNIRAHATEVERLKQEIFRAYLIQTEDFRESIYGVGVGPAPIEPADPEVTPGDAKPEQPGKPENPGSPGDTGNEEPGKPDNPGDTGNEEPGNPGNPGDTGTEEPGNPENPGNPGDTGSGQPEQPQKPDAGTDKKDTTPKLLLCRVSSAKTSNTIRWNSVKSADGYEIYGAASNGKYKRLGTARKKTLQWKHKNLKKGKQYKYYVKAYKKAGRKRVILAKSLPVYTTTLGGKYGNPSKIEVKKTRVSVKTGKKFRLRVEVKGKKIRKAGKKVRYVSANPSVAKVSSQGVITGKKKGSCTVYCIAQNGLYKKVKVTVKK